MESGIALASIGVTVIIGLLVLAYGYGVLTQRTKSNRADINHIQEEFKEYRKDNKADHNLIFAKLDTIIKNGNKKG